MLKYEVAVCSATGLIVWIAGAFEGSKSDDDIIFESGFLEQLDSSEVVYADGAYYSELLHHYYHVFTPKPINFNPTISKETVNAWNHHIQHYRQAIERTFGRLKTFATISHKWRHPIDKNPLLFYLLCKIVNEQITNPTLVYFL